MNPIVIRDMFPLLEGLHVRDTQFMISIMLLVLTVYIFSFSVNRITLSQKYGCILLLPIILGGGIVVYYILAFLVVIIDFFHIDFIVFYGCIFSIPMLILLVSSIIGKNSSRLLLFGAILIEFLLFKYIYPYDFSRFLLILLILRGLLDLFLFIVHILLRFFETYYSSIHYKNWKNDILNISTINLAVIGLLVGVITIFFYL